MNPFPKKYYQLRRYAKKKDLQRNLLFAVWIVFCFVSALLYNNSHQAITLQRQMDVWQLLIWMLIAAFLGFLFFRMWKSWFHPTIKGTIVDTHLTDSYRSSDTPSKLESVTYDFRSTKILTLQTDKQKKRRVRFEQQNSSYSYYMTGIRVIRFHGFPYPINPDRNAPNGFVCIACGRIYADYREQCEGCALPLIHPKDLSELDI